MQSRWSLLKVFLGQYSWRMVLTLMVAMLSSIATILVPLSIGKFYLLVFDFKGSRSDLFNILPDSFFDSVPHFLFFFFALVFIKLVTSFLQRYLIGSIGELLVHQIRNKLFAHQIGLNQRIYDDKGIGKYLLRYSGDLKSIQNYVTKGLIGFAVDLVLIILTLFALAVIDKSLAIICTIAVPLMLIPITILNRKLHGKSVKRRNRRSNLLSFVNQRLFAIASIKAFNREQPELGKFHKRSDKLLSSGLEYHKTSSLIFVLVPAMLYIMIGAVMFTIYHQKEAGLMVDQGALLSAFLLIVTMLPAFRRLLRVMVTWKLGTISFEKLLNVLNLPNESSVAADDLILEDARVELENVSYGFGKARLFSNLNANWDGNGIHLIVGGTGSGKSSLAKLLLGIYHPDSGKILVDKQNIQDVNGKSLRKQATIVSDDFPLIGKTVFEAISYSRKKSKRKGAQKVLNQVQATLKADVKLNLDDVIGDRGSNLSKGQEKILLLTRSLLTQKPILILDEPFVSVEPRTKVHLESLLKSLKSKRTIILLLNNDFVSNLKFDSVLNLDHFNANKATDHQFIRKAG